MGRIEILVRVIARMKMTDLVFDSFPSPEGARLIEVESTATRESRSVGTWLTRDDGAVVLRLTADDVAKCDDDDEDWDDSAPICKCKAPVIDHEGVGPEWCERCEGLVRLSEEVLPE